MRETSFGDCTPTVHRGTRKRAGLDTDRKRNVNRMTGPSGAGVVLSPASAPQRLRTPGRAPPLRFNVSDNGGQLSITIETRLGDDARARSTPRVTPV